MKNLKFEKIEVGWIFYTLLNVIKKERPTWKLNCPSLHAELEIQLMYLFVPIEVYTIVPNDLLTTNDVIIASQIK